MSNRFYYGQQDYIVQLNLMDEAFLNSQGNALLRTGGTMTGAIVGYAGTAALPGLAIGTASNGLYAPAANQVAVSINGTGVATFTSTGLSLPGTLAVTGNGTVGGTLTVTGAASAGSLTLTTKLPVAQGGTGAATAAAALSNLGAAPLAGATFAGAVAIPTLTLTNDLAIADGGTGASTATAALTNLGAAPLAGATFTGAVAAPSLTLTNKLPVTEGGTGASTAAQALTNLGGVDTNTFNSRVGTSGALGFRNRIINGDCRVTQRGTGTFTTNTGGFGGPDRYSASNGNSAGGSFTQSNGFMAVNGVSYNTVRQTIVTPISSISGTNYWYGISQLIEGYNCHDLLGKPITISFYFNSTVAGSYSVTVQDSNLGFSYLYSFTVAANTVTRVEFTTPAIPLTANVPEFSSKGLNINVGALNAGSFSAAATGAWVTGNYIAVNGATNWAAAANNYIELTLLQLEEGTKATVFERRSYGLELSLCQRYCQAIAASGYIGLGLTWTSSASLITVSLQVPMRAVPTVFVPGFTPSQFAIGTANTSAGVNSISLYNATTNNITLNVGMTASLGINLPCFLVVLGVAGTSPVLLSAEL